jgi:hypothetical protein
MRKQIIALSYVRENHSVEKWNTGITPKKTDRMTFITFLLLRAIPAFSDKKVVLKSDSNFPYDDRVYDTYGVSQDPGIGEIHRPVIARNSFLQILISWQSQRSLIVKSLFI